MMKLIARWPDGREIRLETEQGVNIQLTGDHNDAIIQYAGEAQHALLSVVGRRNDDVVSLLAHSIAERNLADALSEPGNEGAWIDEGNLTEDALLRQAAPLFRYIHLRQRMWYKKNVLRLPFTEGEDDPFFRRRVENTDRRLDVATCMKLRLLREAQAAGRSYEEQFAFLHFTHVFSVSRPMLAEFGFTGSLRELQDACSRIDPRHIRWGREAAQGISGAGAPYRVMRLADQLPRIPEWIWNAAERFAPLAADPASTYRSIWNALVPSEAQGGAPYLGPFKANQMLQDLCMLPWPRGGNGLDPDDWFYVHVKEGSWNTGVMRGSLPSLLRMAGYELPRLAPGQRKRKPWTWTEELNDMAVAACKEVASRQAEIFASLGLDYAQYAPPGFEQLTPSVFEHCGCAENKYERVKANVYKAMKLYDPARPEPGEDIMRSVLGL
jgi:hypothetical protein